VLNEQIPIPYATNNRKLSLVREIFDGRTIVSSWHGNCEHPHEVVLWGSKDKDVPGHDLHERVTTVRCRKCDGCRRYRVAQIVSVCGEMARLASRTKFVTLTVDQRWNEKSEDFFVAEMQRYIKRVRAVSNPFLYAWVVEYQQRGAPHAHILIFEGNAGPVTNSHIKGKYLKGSGCWKARWTWGFLDTKIVDNTSSAAWYLIKYLRKDPRSRFRRSVGRQPRKSPQGQGNLLLEQKLRYDFPSTTDRRVIVG